MHEMSYMLRLADLAIRRAEEQHAKRITKITVDVGETSGVIPYYLQKYLPEAAAGTILEGARMVTREIRMLFKAKVEEEAKEFIHKCYKHGISWKHSCENDGWTRRRSGVDGN